MGVFISTLLWTIQLLLSARRRLAISDGRSVASEGVPTASISRSTHVIPASIDPYPNGKLAGGSSPGGTNDIEIEAVPEEIQRSARKQRTAWTAHSLSVCPVSSDPKPGHCKKLTLVRSTGDARERQADEGRIRRRGASPREGRVETLRTTKAEISDGRLRERNAKESWEGDRGVLMTGFQKTKRRGLIPS
jgi:hypothetical protein